MFRSYQLFNFTDLVSFMTSCASPENRILLALKHFRAFVLNEVLFYFMSNFIGESLYRFNILINNLNLLNKVVQTKMPFLELSLGRYF